MGVNASFIMLAALGLLLVSAGIEDARRREIANWKNAGIALLAPAWWWATGIAPWPDLAIQLLLAAVVFGLFLGAFATGQMGGGDVKMIGALALWLPLRSLVDALVVTAVLGGVLTAAMVTDEWVRRRAPRPRPGARALILLLVAASLAAALGLPAAAPLRDSLPATLAIFAGLLAAVSALLLLGVRAVQRRGIAPETPYGVAIAIAGLMWVREPIINHFG
jgi:prepilin peptidase CpaA